MAMTVTQLENDDCHVLEHDLQDPESKPRLVAIFPKEIRVVPSRGRFGPELANRDCAQIRAMVFATTMEELVNRGKIDLG